MRGWSRDHTARVMPLCRGTSNGGTALPRSTPAAATAVAESGYPPDTLGCGIRVGERPCWVLGHKR